MLRNLINNIPPVTKNLLLLNILMYIVLLSGGANEYGGLILNQKLGMHYVYSPLFEPYQIISHMFCHGNFPHLLFNMFALVTIGSLLEKVWGPKRFLIFYFITGLGALFLHEAALAFDLHRAIGSINAHDVVFNETSINYNRFVYDTFQANKIVETYITPVVGASGAVFGLLIGLAMLFPNIELMIIFLPIPIKAKYLVPVLIVIELTLGVNNFEMDNVAHFAHLGGALFGFIMIKIWKRDRNNFY
jgi:rhomboid-like protein